MAQAILCIFLELPEEEDGWGGGTRTSCSLCPTLSSPDLEGWGASKNSFSRFSARNKTFGIQRELHVEYSQAWRIRVGPQSIYGSWLPD